MGGTVEQRRKARREYTIRLTQKGIMSKQKLGVSAPTYIGKLCKNKHEAEGDPKGSVRWTKSRNCVRCHSKLVTEIRQRNLDGYVEHKPERPHDFRKPPFRAVGLMAVRDKWIAPRALEPWLTHPAYADIDFSERGFEVCPRCRQNNEPWVPAHFSHTTIEPEFDSFAAEYERTHQTSDPGSGRRPVEAQLIAHMEAMG